MSARTPSQPRPTWLLPGLVWCRAEPMGRCQSLPHSLTSRAPPAGLPRRCLVVQSCLRPMSVNPRRGAARVSGTEQGPPHGQPGGLAFGGSSGRISRGQWGYHWAVLSQAFGLTWHLLSVPSGSPGQWSRGCTQGPCPLHRGTSSRFLALPSLGAPPPAPA